MEESQKAPRFIERQTAISAGFDEAFAYHHRWLAGHGLLNRPWFVFASAPDPILPSAFPDGTVYAYVKHAGRSARLLGLPKADVTLLSEARARDEEPDGLDRGRVLLVRRKLPLSGRLARLTGRVGTKDLDVLRTERDSYTIRIVGSLFNDGSEHSRPSMTVPMLCFAIAHGIPKIILAGMSLDRSGYSYEPSAAPRKHVREDRLVLDVIAKRYPQVVTTEPSLHAHAGLPLFEC